MSVGDTVRWTFEQTANPVGHNLWLTAPGATPVRLSSPNVPPGSSEEVTYEVPAEGVYDFYCSIHFSTMKGRILAGGVDPGPVGPQPLPNPSDPPSVYEEGDNAKPKLRRVRVRGIRRGVKVTVTLSEPGRLDVTLKRKGERVRKRVKGLTAGTQTKRIRDKSLDAGTYRVTVRAADKVGNKSRAIRARVRIKG